MDILQAICGRKSTRAYLDTPVPKEHIQAILDAARWAPSGVNIQPWHVHIVQGTTKKEIGDRIISARESGQKQNPDYAYYPEIWQEPYRSRRSQCGLSLYQALDVKKEDTEKRKTIWDSNYHFFHAPIGLLFLIDRTLSPGNWLDMGMFLQNIMLAAREFGLETCPQAAMAEYPDIVREVLNINSNELLLCGLALGYPDKTHPVNSYRLERIEVNEFTQWHD